MLAAAVPASSNANEAVSLAARDKIEDHVPPYVPINARANDKQFIADLLTSPNQAERSKLLNRPGDYVFDFATEDPPEGAANAAGKGGLTVSANAKTMPALIGLDSAMTIAFLGPCGMNTPHIHPRGTELAAVVAGRLVTNMIVENGVEPYENTIDTFQMAVFPQGSMHLQYNPDCEEAVFVGAFNSEDPGTSTIAQNFFNLRPAAVEATLGGPPLAFDGADLETFKDSIPANIALGIEACLQKCNIDRKKKRDINDLVLEKAGKRV